MGAALSVLLLCLLAPSVGMGQQAAPKQILAIYWYSKDYPGNIEFDTRFQAELRRRAPAGVEFYSEYLEDNRFPGENQSILFREYLRRKYAGRPLDVIAANTHTTLNFLLENRDVLFPRVPIVFGTLDPPPPEQLQQGAGATGILYLFTYRETLELALRLHPGTEHVFVVSGAPSDRPAREELRDFAKRVEITYLTNLPLAELIQTVRTLPGKSIVLYHWQRILDGRGGIVESTDVLSLMARQSRAPIYSMSGIHIGLGVVGGYGLTVEGNAVKMAELAWRVANGARPSEIPVAPAPSAPIFDWRELQRWNISESWLPPGSVIRFRELSFWQRYRWRMVGVLALLAFQCGLIAALLIASRHARKKSAELEEYKDRLEKLVQSRTVELVEARDQALAANRSKSVFLANVSHELRTPLNAILGFTGLILNRSGLSDRDRHDLSLVGNSGEHLLTLIDDVLDMAKIETGRVTVESHAFDLPALVDETARMLRGRAHAKNLELVVHIGPAVPHFIRSDSGKLRQILTNLIGNAVKYTERGSVTVRLDSRSRSAPLDPLLIVDVEDTGIGIAAEDQARIFDPFVQAGNARSVKGTGLGLSITRSFVKLLGGGVSVESEVGRGSRFRVEIPARPATAEEVAAPAAGLREVLSLAPEQPEFRILVVEDHEANWILLNRLLQEVGFLVRVVENGEQAIEAFLEWRPHFIWMDLRLPGISGMEAAKQIRALDGGQDVRIVAVTGSTFSSQREEVLAAGFDGFLRKPYRPREIFDSMASLLGAGYLYRERVAAEAPGALSPADLAALPKSLRDDLAEALISLDAERIAAVVARVADQDPAIASILRRFTASYAYTPILDALQSGAGRRPTSA